MYLHIVHAKSAKIKEWMALDAVSRYICVTNVAGDGHRNAILVDFHVALEVLKLFEFRFGDFHPFGDIDRSCLLAEHCCRILSGLRCLKKSVDAGKNFIANAYRGSVRSRTWL